MEWLENWGRRDRLRDDTIPLDSRAMLDYGHLALAFGEYEEAGSVYEMVLASDHQSSGLMLTRALQLFRSGQSRAAATLVSSISHGLKEESITNEMRAAMLVLALDEGDRDLAKTHV